MENVLELLKNNINSLYARNTIKQQWKQDWISLSSCHFCLCYSPFMVFHGSWPHMECFRKPAPQLSRPYVCVRMCVIVSESMCVDDSSMELIYDE